MSRVVAISLFAAICLGSPATTGTASAEQMVKGHGARDRSGGDSARSGGDRSGGDRKGGDRSGGEQPRTARQRDDGGDHDDGQRRAVPRDNGRDNQPRNTGRDHDNGPRVVVRERPNVNINIGSFRGPRFYAPTYYDRWARNYYRWSPIGFVPWSLIYGAAGWSNFGFYASLGPNPYAAPYGYYGSYGPGPYSPWQVSGPDIGGVRLKIRPRDAQVFVDGYYAGLVDDFDGSFQSLRLEAGGHKIEIHMPGYEDFEIDVHVQPGRTLTLQEDLRPRP